MVEIFVERRPEGVGEPTEEAAFAELYNRTYNPLVAYCRRYCPPGYDAEDIAQEALSRAWSSWDRYSPSRPFWPWVATIARRLCVDYWRRDERALARAGGTAALDPVVTPRPDELSEVADECRMAVSAFRRLRPDHQRIVGLRDIEGWSYEDIARFEGVTVESIRGSLRRARMSLRKSYDSLSKGGVAALVPGLGELVRRFSDARAAMSVRLARWQTALGDTGVASTRLGEALVSLVAISVAAVGLGAPGATLAANDVRGGGDSAAAGAGSGGAVLGGAGGAAGPVAAVAGSAGEGAGAQNITPEWQAPDLTWKPDQMLVPGSPTPMSDSTILSVVESPNFLQDKTLFAVGRAVVNCVAPCRTLYRSNDAGKTWVGLPAIGLAASRVMLPPAFPADGRIFATGENALQVSEDGGRTFVPLTLSLGTAAMSPGFSSGDPRIFLADAPGRQYDDRLGATTPLDLSPSAANASNSFSFAFPSAYDVANPLMFVGGSTVGGASAGKVFRCEGTTCGVGVSLEGADGTPSVVVGHGPSGDIVYAFENGRLYRSLDSARSFTEMSMPASVGSIVEYSTDQTGGVTLLGVNGNSGKDEIWRSLDFGVSWTRIPGPQLEHVTFNTARTLATGAIVVGLEGFTSGLACTTDEGRTWLPEC